MDVKMGSFLVPSHLKKIRSVKWNDIYDEKNFLYCVIRHLWPETDKISKGEKKFLKLIWTSLI